MKTLWSKRFLLTGFLAFGAIWTIAVLQTIPKHPVSSKVVMERSKNLSAPAPSVPETEKTEQKKISELPEPVVWQVSEEPIIRFGVRDKYSTLGGYDALFIVTGPEHQKTQTQVHVLGSEFKYVTFPDDFPDFIDDQGKFTWVCLVHGKVVVKGGFTYGFTKQGYATLTVPREN